MHGYLTRMSQYGGELLTYDMADDACVITSESLQYMDSICVAAEFYQAYPNGITETMMDYYSFNGAGEALNQNAVENRNSDFYKSCLRRTLPLCIC